MAAAGINSGRAGTKGSTENMHALDIRKLHRAGRLTPGASPFTWQWSRGGNVVASISITVYTSASVTLDYRTRRHGEWQGKRYQVMMEWTACHFGGTRPWWNCPCCGKRVAVLWAGSTYACRDCQKINYESTRRSESDKPFDRANKLRKRLGWVPGVAHGMGDKPKGMHWTTYARLLEQYTVHSLATVDSTNKLLARLKCTFGP